MTDRENIKRKRAIVESYLRKGLAQPGLRGTVSLSVFVTSPRSNSLQTEDIVLNMAAGVYTVHFDHPLSPIFEIKFFPGELS